jgi:hypothetical protein
MIAQLLGTPGQLEKSVGAFLLETCGLFKLEVENRLLKSVNLVYVNFISLLFSLYLVKSTS